MTLRSKISPAFASLLLAGFLSTQGVAQEATAKMAAQSDGVAQWSASAFGLEARHPAEYYQRSMSLFQAGRRDEAVFLFYLGQLRYRLYLTANPTLPKDRDPALFASLSEVVGRPLNEYAFGDIPTLARIIDAVLAYDEAHPDRFTSATPQQRHGVREGLKQMRSTILAKADDIRAQRVKNGLQNRN